MSFEEVQAKADKVNSNMDFQLQFMHGAIREIVKKSSSGLTCSGFENLDPKKAYLFIANHRDILLDAAILQILLVEHGFQTSEITFGSNLKETKFITDFGRLNRMFTVRREGTSKELYEISRKLSAYIRHTLVDKNVSVWIAQRNGRTKDGNDQTQSGLLKMLQISGNKKFSEGFKQLNIIPLTISYEYEPCDQLKTQELYLSGLLSKYNKSSGEDLNSILTGITQFKGNIHLKVGEAITEKEFCALDTIENENDKFKALASLMDKRFLGDYQLNVTNRIAYDLLLNTNTFGSYYTPEQTKTFIHYMNEKIEPLTGDKEILRNIFLKLYAQSVINHLKLNELKV